MSDWRAMALGGVMLLASGCVRYAAADAAVAPGRFDSLWRRDLSALEHRIAVERHSGTDDDWTAVAQSWLDLANCDDLERERLDAPLPEFVNRTLVAEETRRALELYRAASERKRVGEAIFTDAAVPDFFARDAVGEEDGLIRWPQAREGWVDEVPASRAVASKCSTLRERVLATPLRRDDEESPARNFQDWLTTYLETAAAVDAAYAALEPDQRTGAVELVAWRTRLWVAALADQISHRWAEFADEADRRARRGVSAQENLARFENATVRAAELADISHRTLQAVAGKVPHDAPANEVAHAKLLLAAYELRADHKDQALTLLAEARGFGLEGENFWAARYLELKVSSDAGLWEQAAELANGLPPRTSRYHGAYFYRIAVATRRLQQPDRFLNITMKAFRDRPYKSDPFLRALYWETLQALADFVFEDRIIEMLEDMGPRGELDERVEEYARTALDRGRPANATAAAAWLLAHNHDARYHPRYHGIMALAAFLDDDPEKFRKAATAVAERPGKVTEALPQRRQPAFFASADAELARLLRQMLPVMAEWGDDAEARDRRQRWLRVIVDHAQAFVRSTDDTLSRPQLVELYRLASALLDDHPRGYAERVGEQEPAPLVLGTVRVDRRELEEFEPVVELEVPAPYSLTLIPRDDLPPAEWTSRWPADEEAP